MDRASYRFESILKAAGVAFVFLSLVAVRSVAATTTPEAILPEELHATSTEDAAMIVEDASTATDEAASLAEGAEEPEDSSEASEEGQVLGEETAGEIEEEPNEEDAEEDLSQEPAEEEEENELIEEANGPVLGEGAGESRSPARFMAPEEEGADIPARAVSGIEFDPEAAHSCVAKVFSLSLGGEEEASGYVSISGDASRTSLGSLLVGSLPEGIDVTFSASGKHELDVSPEGQEIGIRAVRGRNAQKGSFMIPVVYSLFDGHSSSTVACQINIVNQ